MAAADGERGRFARHGVGSVAHGQDDPVGGDAAVAAAGHDERVSGDQRFVEMTAENGADRGSSEAADGPRPLARPIDPWDVPAGLLLVVQRRARTLPVATAGFVDQLAKTFAERFECV